MPNNERVGANENMNRIVRISGGSWVKLCGNTLEEDHMYCCKSQVRNALSGPHKTLVTLYLLT